MICDICESNITLPEGEHGVLIGRCPICGAGYGGASPDPIKTAAYEESQRIIEEARRAAEEPAGPEGPFSVYFGIPHLHSPGSEGYFIRPMGSFGTIPEAEAFVWEHEQEWVFARISNTRDDFGRQYRREINHRDTIWREWWTPAVERWRESVRRLWEARA